MKEIETFLIRQQQMVEAHKVQMEIPMPKHAIVPDHAQELENEQKIAELRQHIAQLRGDLTEVSKLPEVHRKQLAKWGRIYSHEPQV